MLPLKAASCTPDSKVYDERTERDGTGRDGGSWRHYIKEIHALYQLSGSDCCQTSKFLPFVSLLSKFIISYLLLQFNPSLLAAGFFKGHLDERLLIPKAKGRWWRSREEGDFFSRVPTPMSRPIPLQAKARSTPINKVIPPQSIKQISQTSSS